VDVVRHDNVSADEPLVERFREPPRLNEDISSCLSGEYPLAAVYAHCDEEHRRAGNGDAFQSAKVSTFRQSVLCH